MGKTPEYTKRAIRNYNAKFDRVAVNLPKGAKEIIKEYVGQSCNAYIVELVLKDLEKRGVSRGKLYMDDGLLTSAGLDPVHNTNYIESNGNNQNDNISSAPASPLPAAEPSSDGGRILQENLTKIIGVQGTSQKSSAVSENRAPVSMHEVQAPQMQMSTAATQAPPVQMSVPSTQAPPVQMSTASTQTSPVQMSTAPTQAPSVQVNAVPQASESPMKTTESIPLVNIINTATPDPDTSGQVMSENAQSIPAAGKVPPSPLVKALLKNAAGPVQNIQSNNETTLSNETGEPPSATQDAVLRAHQIQRDTRQEVPGQTIEDMMSAREQQEDELSRLIEQKLMEEQERERQLGRRWPGMN